MNPEWGHIPNLHITLGGDTSIAGSYLPFGQNMVRALIRSGRYAAQSRKDLAGVIIECRVVGEQRYLRIHAEAGCQMFVDSGWIDTQNVGIANPELLTADGRLHYSTALRAYTAEEKLLGTIYPPAVASAPTVEGTVTKAFAAKVDEEGRRDGASESQLADKKFCASRIPPSLSTGKLRLYLQAHYGAKLDKWKFAANLLNQPPCLEYAQASGETVNTFSFDCKTTGIYTDGNKRHWFIKLTSSTVKIYRMNASKCAEKLRGKLRDPEVSDADKERIEAYILSESYPDFSFVIERAQSLPLLASMGYGWHFNWSGTAADIVAVETIALTPPAFMHRSTHLRLTIARNDAIPNIESFSALDNESRRWSVSLETVETATWKNSKWQNVIAFPNWGEDQLEIFGQMWGDRFGDEAPIYCFYVRDDLKVVRYSRDGDSGALRWQSISTPSYFVGNRGPETSGTPAFPSSAKTTIGLEAGEGELRVDTAHPVTTAFSVGDAVVQATTENYSFTKAVHSVKTRRPDPYYSDVFVFGTPKVLTTDGGRPTNATGIAPYGLLPSSFIWEEQSIVSDHPYVHTTIICNGHMSTTDSTGTHTETVYTLAVVPFYDAEAVYLWGQKQTSISESGTVAAFLCQLDHIQETKFTNTSQGQGIVKEIPYTAPGPTGGVYESESDFDTSETTTESLGQFCVSNAGTLTWEEQPGLSAFFAGEPTQYVSQYFTTLASAGGSIKGEGIPLTGGYGAEFGNHPGVFAGFA